MLTVSVLRAALSANVPLPLGREGRGEDEDWRGVSVYPDPPPLGGEISTHHCKRMSTCRNTWTRHDDMTSIHRLQKVLDGTLADLAAVLNPLLDRFAKMKPDQDT